MRSCRYRTSSPLLGSICYQVMAALDAQPLSPDKQLRHRDAEVLNKYPSPQGRDLTQAGLLTLCHSHSFMEANWMLALQNQP
jgi:hypothetical protein